MWKKRGTAVNIFITNLSRGVSEADLEAVFAAYGQVASVAIKEDRYADVRQRGSGNRDDVGLSRGHAWVEMLDSGQAQTAIEALNGTRFKGRAIVVIQALPLGSKGGKRSPHAKHA